jgi:hypothetical protein
MTGDIYGFVHDPTVIKRDDGTYFLFTTNNKTNIASAPSMSGPWTHLGSLRCKWERPPTEAPNGDENAEHHP